jgi:hypothetical protein
MTCRPLLLLLPAAVVVALTLTGCSSVPRIEVPREVAVPVPVACVGTADVPRRPALRTDDEILGLDDYRSVHALWAAYGRLQAYVAELEIIARRCSEIQQQPP